MKVAYEAADASHPKGKCKLAASKGTLPGRAFYRILHAAIIFIGKETPGRALAAPSRFCQPDGAVLSSSSVRGWQTAFYRDHIEPQGLNRRGFPGKRSMLTGVVKTGSRRWIGSWTVADRHHQPASVQVHGVWQQDQLPEARL